MRRREFIAGLVLAATMRQAQAQQIGRTYRIGVLADRWAPPFDALTQGLQSLGYIDGKNITFEYRWAEGNIAQYPLFAKELVALNVDLIVAHATPATFAAQNATAVIPIVMTSTSDVNIARITKQLSRPDRNITGFVTLNGAVLEKRLELIQSVVSQAKTIGYFTNSENVNSQPTIDLLEAAARKLDVELIVIPLRRSKFQEAFQVMISRRPNGVIVSADPVMLSQQTQIIQFMSEQRIPAIYAYIESVRRGGLLSYGPDTDELFRRAASYIDRILKGIRPSDLPIQQPEKFELVVNLKTAKALGLAVPAILLARADEVIE